jgi:hypothetical protein
MNMDASQAFLEACTQRVGQARAKINHCLDQLQDGDIWWTPREGSNSIGILIQHLMGNLGQWVISGIAGEADVRNRPREFRAEQKTSRAELQAGLNEVLDRSFRQEVCKDTSGDLLPDLFFDQRSVHEHGAGVNLRQ